MDATPLHDIDDIYAPVEPAAGLPVEWIIAGVLALILALAVFFVVRRRRLPSRRRHDDPREAALLKLRYLLEHHADLSSRECGLDTTDALREYLGAFHDRHAPFETTGELLAALRRGGIGKSAHRDIAEIFRGCDAMKYAAVEETADRRRLLVDSAIRFIEGDTARRTQPTTRFRNEDPAAA